MLVTEGVYAIFIKTPGPLKTVNCYLLKDGDESYLVDTNWSLEDSYGYFLKDGHESYLDETHWSSRGSWAPLLGLFDEAGADPKKLRGIIITHAHEDHMAYLPKLQELTGAPALLHSSEVQAHTIRSGSSDAGRVATGRWFQQHGAPDEIVANILEYMPTFPAIPLGTVRSLSDGEVITIGSMRWEVVLTPGHSPGHICLLERSRGLLLTGDHVLPHDTPNIHVHPHLPENPLGSYISSLQRVERLPVRQALPGHGDVINNFQAVVANLISHHDVRFADIIESLRSGPRNAFAVACSIPWVGRRMSFMQLTHRERWMALGETIAHLQALEERGIIKTISFNGNIGWSVVAA